MSNPTLDPDVELTLGDLFGILLRSWLAILAFTVLGILVSAAIAYSMERSYVGVVLLAPAPSDESAGSSLAQLAGQFAPLAGLVGGIDAKGGLDSKDVRIATLRSRQLTEAFIVERNLLPVLFPDRWNPDTKSWREKNGKSLQPSIGAGVRLIDREVRHVTEDRRTGLVTQTIEWRDPRVAADWANDLAARVNQYLRARAIEEASRSISFLEAALEKTNVVERRQIIYRLIESKTSEIMMANARKEYAFIVVDPAAAAEPEYYVRPQRAIIMGSGLILGAILGCIYALIWRRRRSADVSVTP